MQHTLTAGGMAHDGDLAAAKLVFLVFFDILQTLRDLARIAVQVSQAPGLVGGGKVQGEEGPFGLL